MQFKIIWPLAIGYQKQHVGKIALMCMYSTTLS
jgi:hypothetical protein